MFFADTRQIRQFEKKVESIGKQALPTATRFTLNEIARAGMNISRKHVDKKMTLRNRYTQRSILFNRASGRDIYRQESETGSIAEYMIMQEFGGYNTSNSGGIMIPTRSASNEGRGSADRTKLPIRSNKLANIKLKRRKRVAKTRKQANLFAVQDAVMTGNRYVYLDFGTSKGIFKVKGGRKNFKRGGPKGAKVEMMYRHQGQTYIPATPWLAPSSQRAASLGPLLYKKALNFQLRRAGAR